MMYSLIVMMSILLVAYAAAWIFIPALRQLFETPKNELLLHGDKFVERHLQSK